MSTPYTLLDVGSKSPAGSAEDVLGLSWAVTAPTPMMFSPTGSSQVGDDKPTWQGAYKKDV